MTHENSFWRVCEALGSMLRLELLGYLMTVETTGFPCVNEVLQRMFAAVIGLACVFLTVASAGAATVHRSFSNGYPTSVQTAAERADAVRWELKYTEDFKGNKLNERLWTRIGPGRPDWCKNMSLRPDLVTVKDGQLHCRGVRNGDRTADPRAVLTGGVMTKGKFALRYGKVEFRMKLDDGQKGAWPAVWMMPETTVRGWPNDGEIDIVERLNSDDFVYQTLHYGNGSPRDLSHGGRGKIRKGEWNVYGLEWTPDSIVWTVNGAETFRHQKGPNDDELKFPWTTPFYLMIDMQLGGSWVGGVEESTLPTAMHVDWVKFYHGTRGGKRFSEFVNPQAK